jgi:D-3-phosphoglycerate dehydrogenase
MKRNIIFDFDSTLVHNESLNDILKLALNNQKDKFERVQKIVEDAMNGLITPKESMDYRLSMAPIDKNLIENATAEIKIVDGMIDLILELKKTDNVLIVSGGFKSMIVPIATKYFLMAEENIYANEFIYDVNGLVKGTKENLLLEPQGKVKLIKTLGLEGEKIMIGDGYTDLETYLHGATNKFIAFFGVVKREKVAKEAKLMANNVEELKEILLQH